MATRPLLRPCAAICWISTVAQYFVFCFLTALCAGLLLAKPTNAEPSDDVLFVSPLEGFSAQGNQGGPFAPSSTTYTLSTTSVPTQL